jgi:ATP-dependent helicase HepA
MRTQLIGNLVSSDEFKGVGKVYSVDEVQNVATVTFFESPENTDARPLVVSFELLKEVSLGDETVVYCIHPLHKKWQRARYGGSRPNGQHLVIFRQGEDDVMPISDIYVINIGEKHYLDPRAFLSQRCSDTPLFLNHRSNFVNSYIEQRKACKSISSVLSSGIELEVYQLAVVRRVLQDNTKKYLLADEVGLGKTIEAGMIIRELMIHDFSCKAIIAVPETLIQQWTDELTQRFFLGALLDESIIICSHDDFENKLIELGTTPKIVVIDEAHQISDRGWSNNIEIKKSYSRIAKACAQSEVCLLLSGTPLNGNESNFLSMLHLLNPESYSLSKEGIENFKVKILERESLGGIYQALTPSNDNTTLSDLLEQIKSVIPLDALLNKLIDITAPLVDWIDGEEEGDDRSQAINNIRSYLGENYRLHQRMLRNRREDPYISGLFPGLAGVEVLPWSIDETSLSIEQSLDRFRGEFLSTNIPTETITHDNFRTWISQALSNPILVAERATKALEKTDRNIETFEIEMLEELINNAKQEQEEKDFIFLSYIERWLNNNTTGKIIVFGGNAKTVKYVAPILTRRFGDMIELHVPGEILQFNKGTKIRILICDENGEDGLNLHGGKKLVVHYDLPMSISRIEQRLGRVNRYSADIAASPIQSIAFSPQSNSFSNHWLRLLNEDIKIFNKSVASLQYVLEPHIERAWISLSTIGYEGLIAIGKEFRGESGLIHSECLKIKSQEQLNNLESEIHAAQEYSLRILESDERAELHANKMEGWLTKGLLFRRKRGEKNNTFRYEYQTGTLMDSKTFISKCLLGIDFDSSTPRAPVTHLMSFDRQVCSQGSNTQPFRYGQPFLDTIYDALNTDSRGISAAQIRYLNASKIKEPVAFFNIEWFVSHKSNNQIASDETYPPHIIRQWLTSAGALVKAENIVSLLEKPYNPKGDKGYTDVNLRSERWEWVEEYFPQRHWAELVNSTYQRGYEQAIETLDSNIQESLSIDCLSFSVVIVAGAE